MFLDVFGEFWKKIKKIFINFPISFHRCWTWPCSWRSPWWVSRSYDVKYQYCGTYLDNCCILIFLFSFYWHYFENWHICNNIIWYSCNKRSWWSSGRSKWRPGKITVLVSFLMRTDLKTHIHFKTIQAYYLQKLKQETKTLIFRCNVLQILWKVNYRIIFSQLTYHLLQYFVKNSKILQWICQNLNLIKVFRFPYIRVVRLDLMKENLILKNISLLNCFHTFYLMKMLQTKMKCKKTLTFWPHLIFLHFYEF